MRGWDGTMFNGKPLMRYIWRHPTLGDLMTQSDLRARGWSLSLIRKILGEPDCYGHNPRGGQYVRLYSENRVRRASFAVANGGREWQGPDYPPGLSPD